MKQTAVEWLDEQIEYISIQIIDGFLTIKEFMEEREKLFKQAKEMEKQQQGCIEEDMKFAYKQGARLALLSQSELVLHKGKFPTPDEWFETFKNK